MLSNNCHGQQASKRSDDSKDAQDLLAEIASITFAIHNKLEHCIIRIDESFQFRNRSIFVENLKNAFQEKANLVEKNPSANNHLKTFRPTTILMTLNMDLKDDTESLPKCMICG